MRQTSAVLLKTRRASSEDASLTIAKAEIGDELQQMKPDTVTIPNLESEGLVEHLEMISKDAKFRRCPDR